MFQTSNKEVIKRPEKVNRMIFIHLIVVANYFNKNYVVIG